MKKAQNSIVVGVILVILAAFILFGFFARLKTISRGFLTDAQCMMRVMISERAKKASLGADRAPALCSADFNVIIPQQLEDALPKTLFSCKNKNLFEKSVCKLSDNKCKKKVEMIYYLLKEAKKCWYKYGSGKFDIFSSWRGFFGKTFCVPCGINVPVGFEGNISTSEIYWFIKAFKDCDKNIQNAYEIMNSKENYYFDGYSLYYKKRYINLSKTTSVFFVKRNMNEVWRNIGFKTIRKVTFWIKDIFIDVSSNIFGPLIKIFENSDAKKILNNLNKEITEHKLMKYIVAINSTIKNEEINNKLDELHSIVKNIADLKIELKELLDELSKRSNVNSEETKIVEDKINKVNEQINNELKNIKNRINELNELSSHDSRVKVIKNILEKYYEPTNEERQDIEVILKLGYISLPATYDEDTDRKTKEFQNIFIEYYNFLNEIIAQLNNNKLTIEKIGKESQDIVDKLRNLKRLCSRKIGDECCNNISNLVQLGALCYFNKKLKGKKLIDKIDIKPNNNYPDSIYQPMYVERSYNVNNGYISQTYYVYYLWLGVFNLEIYWKLKLLSKGLSNNENELHNKKYEEYLTSKGYLSGLLIDNPENAKDICDIFLVP